MPDKDVSEIRVWTLAFDGHYTNAALNGDYNQSNGITREPVWVVEASPVADLLERWKDRPPYFSALDVESEKARQRLRDETHALLQALRENT